MIHETCKELQELRDQLREVKAIATEKYRELQAQSQANYDAGHKAGIKEAIELAEDAFGNGESDQLAQRVIFWGKNETIRLKDRLAPSLSVAVQRPGVA